MTRTEAVIISVFILQKNLLLSSVNDRGELLGNQGSSADQTAVHVGLCQKLGSICVVHGSTVLDGYGLGNLCTVHISQNLTDLAAGLLCLLGRKT